MGARFNLQNVPAQTPNSFVGMSCCCGGGRPQPQPALESNVNSRTTERPEEDIRRTTEDKRMREGKQHEHTKRTKERLVLTGQCQKNNRTT